MEYEYAANKGGVLTDAQAVVVGKELAKIEKEHGHIDPKVVYNKARAQKSVFHQYFTWDVQKSAEKNWLHEARMLIRSVIIIPMAKEAEDIKTVRAFISVSPHEGEKRFDKRSYISTLEAVNDESYCQQMLQQAYDELTTWKDRYQKWKQFIAIFGAVIAAMPTVEKQLPRDDNAS